MQLPEAGQKEVLYKVIIVALATSTHTAFL